MSGAFGESSIGDRVADEPLLETAHVQGVLCLGVPVHLCICACWTSTKYMVHTVASDPYSAVSPEWAQGSFPIAGIHAVLAKYGCFCLSREYGPCVRIVPGIKTVGIA